MKPALYIVLNQGLGMSTGKSAAQASHAAVEAFRISTQDASMESHLHSTKVNKLVEKWYEGGHYAKYIMAARDTGHLLTIERYLEARGFRSVLIIDEGHTEIDPLIPTALGVALVDKDDPHTAATFSSLKLYKDPKPEVKVDQPLKVELTPEAMRLLSKAVAFETATFRL